MQVIKILGFFLLLSIYFLLLALIGYGIKGIWGWTLMVGIGGMALFLAMFLGDKLILAISKSRKLNDVVLSNEVNNFKCLLGITEIEIYYSTILKPNIYVLSNQGSRASIIVGGDIRKILSKSELRSLIYYSTLKLNSNDVPLLLSSNFIVLFLSIPELILSKIEFLSFLRIVYSFLMIPLNLMRQYFFLSINTELQNKIKTVELKDIANSFSSAQFKLKHSGNEGNTQVLSILMENLTCIENEQQVEQFDMAHV